MKRVFVFLVTLALMCTHTAVALELPDIFADHMVLQQKMEAPIWGKAEPGADISATVDGTTRKAKADSDGIWRINLPELQVPGPYTIDISEAGGGKHSIKDVLVGEVWICSGQSNMEWSVAVSGDKDLEQVTANHPHIRQFYVNHMVSGEPKFNAPGKWSVCSPDTILGFTAV